MGCTYWSSRKILDVFFEMFEKSKPNELMEIHFPCRNNLDHWIVLSSLKLEFVHPEIPKTESDFPSPCDQSQQVKTRVRLAYMREEESQNKRSASERDLVIMNCLRKITKDVSDKEMEMPKGDDGPAADITLRKIEKDVSYKEMEMPKGDGGPAADTMLRKIEKDVSDEDLDADMTLLKIEKEVSDNEVKIPKGDEGPAVDATSVENGAPTPLPPLPQLIKIDFSK